MVRQLTIWLRLRVEDCRFRIREIMRRNLRKLVEIALTDLDLMGAFRDVGASAAFERDHLNDAAAFQGPPSAVRLCAVANPRQAERLVS
jgi:hypothetical protein